MTYVTKILLALAISEAVVAGKYVYNETINAKHNHKNVRSMLFSCCNF